MNKRKIIINPGTEYNNLTFIRDGKSRIMPSGAKCRVARVKCNKCSKIFNTIFHQFVRSWSSCKCDKNKDVGTPLYNVWNSMRNRCKPTFRQKQYYFEKGITVCKKWDSSYYVFKDWALNNGYNKNLQLDRKNNKKGYYPSNCRFVTSAENIGNRDITIRVYYKGKLQTLTSVCRLLGYDECRYALIINRIKKGWKHKKAIETPPLKGNYKYKKHKKANWLKCAQ